jgi:hypothetical protein
VTSKLVPLFWLSLIAAVPIAFLAPPGTLRWIAIGWLGAIGLLASLANWFILAAVVLRKRNGASMVPLIGGLLLGLAIAAIPLKGIRIFAALGLLFDPFVVASVWPFHRERSDKASPGE